MVHTSRIQQVQYRLRWLALPFFFLFPSLVVQSTSRLLFLLGFWFCLLLLTHFSLHAQGKQHSGWLGLIFCLEEGCVCCNHGCCHFWRKVQAPASTMFSVRQCTQPLLTNESSPKNESLSIHKSIAKTVSLPIQESTATVGSILAFFIVGCYIPPPP